MAVEGVEEVTDGPKKEEEQDVQEHMYPVHESSYMEHVEALK